MSFHIFQAQKEYKKGGRIESYNCLKLELKLFHETYLINYCLYVLVHILKAGQPKLWIFRVSLLYKKSPQI